VDAIEALADPTRRRVVELLGSGELTAGQIAEQFSSSRPAVSRHLRLLREAGLVSVREDGTRRLYQLQRQPLADLETWLAQRLDALDTELRRGNRRTSDEKGQS
jgi:DNA-binding transcriptional ArsR family regulator